MNDKSWFPNLYSGHNNSYHRLSWGLCELKAESAWKRGTGVSPKCWFPDIHLLPFPIKAMETWLRMGEGQGANWEAEMVPTHQRLDIQAVSFEKCQETPPTWEIPQPDGDLGAVT